MVFIHSSDAPRFDVGHLNVDIKALVILVTVGASPPLGFKVFICHFNLAFAIADWTQFALDAPIAVRCIDPSFFAARVAVAVGAGLG